MCRLAQGYFEDRDRYVRTYAGEAVMISGEGVLLHAPANEMSARAIFEALGGEPSKGYGVFLKLVQEEEAELREPYAI